MWWLPLAAAAIKGGQQEAASGASANPIAATQSGKFGFDNSNWTVATGRATATLSPASPALLVAGAVVVGLIVWKLAKKS
jgi:hypothetical protein